MSRYRVSMDIGGTFTDVVVSYDEQSGTYTAGCDDRGGGPVRLGVSG